MPAGYPGGVLQFRSDKGLGPQVRPLKDNAFAQRFAAVKARLAEGMTA